MLFASLGTACTPADMIVVVDDWGRPPPPTLDSELPRIIAEFRKAACAPSRFPLALTTLPASPELPAACLNTGRCMVTPGRIASARQSVPSRTRRKVRVWERDVAA